MSGLIACTALYWTIQRIISDLGRSPADHKAAPRVGDELGKPDNTRQDKQGRPVFAASTDWR